MLPVLALIFSIVTAQTELTDENFEHLTQALSGSSTGDWFLLAYNESEESAKWLAQWKELAAKEGDREAPINIAQINTDINTVTAYRLKVKVAPQRLYLHNRKSYNVTAVESAAEAREDVLTLTNFRARKIKEIPSTFQNIMKAIGDFIKVNLKHNPVLFIIGIIVSIIGFIFGTLWITGAIEKEKAD